MGVGAVRFAIGIRTFARKADAEAEVRRILNETPLGTLRGSDAVLIADLFKLHPDAAEKARDGVAGFVVQINSNEGVTARGFAVLHPSGATTRFSYRACLRPSEAVPCHLAAMRAAILLSQRAFRTRAFLAKAPCAHCQTAIGQNERAEVHHEPPGTFRALADAWVKLHGVPQVVSAAGWGDDFKSPDAKRSWVEFHDRHSRRSLLCMPCHYAAEGRTFPKRNAA